MKLLAFGEILWDIIDREYYLGGAPFNFAAHFVKCGGTSFIISEVGHDILGTKALEKARELRVRTDFVAQLHTVPTPTVDVFLNQGQPDYTIHEQVGFDFITIRDLAKIQSASFDIFYFGTLAQRSPVSRDALHTLLEKISFKFIFFDINLRKRFYSEAIIHYSLFRCTIFKINDEEVTIVGELLKIKYESLEEFARTVALDYNIDLIIITAAEKGCYIFHEDKFDHVPGFKVTVVDAVGAGDSFSAAFMRCYYTTRDAVGAARIANEIGAFVASRRGAIPDYSKGIIDVLSKV